MNCPSRADPDVLEKGWNQSPSTLALHKNDELNGRVNLTRQRDHRIPLEQPLKNAPPQDDGRGNGSESGIGLDNMIVERAVEMDGEPTLRPQASRPRSQSLDARRSLERELAGTGPSSSISENEGDTRSRSASKEATCLRPLKRWARPLWRKLVKYARFIGPGFLISVAYIDPGMALRQADLHPTGEAQQSHQRRKLCHRCRCGCLVPVRSACHDLGRKLHCHLPPVTSYQAGLRNRTQLGREL